MADNKINAGQFPDVDFKLTDFIIKTLADGTLEKDTVQNLANKIATLGESGFKGKLLIADTPNVDGWWIAGESGTYTNAGGLVVSLANQFVIIVRQTTFSQIEIPLNITFDATPTTGSTNAVTSEGIKTYVDTNIPILQSNGVFDVINKADEKVYQAIRSIRVLNATIGDEYYLDASAIKYQNGDTEGLVLSIKKYVDGVSDVQVCQYFNAGFTSADDFPRVTLNQVASSGITAEVIINWGNVSYATTNTTFENTKINKNCVDYFIIENNVFNADDNEKSGTMKVVNDGITKEIPLNQSNSAFLITNPNTSNDAGDFYKSVKYVKVFNADPNELYYLKYIQQKTSNGDTTGIACSVNIVSNDTKVCEIFNTSYTSTDRFPVITINEFGGSGITAEIKIDWNLSGITINPFTTEQTTINPLYYVLDETNSQTNQRLNALEIKDNLLQQNDVFDILNPYSDLDLYGIIRNIRLFNAEPNESYYVATINFRWISENGLALSVKRVSDNVNVCDVYNTSLTSTDRFTKVTLAQKNDSGITGELVVDWDYDRKGFVKSNMTSDNAKIKKQNIEYKIDNYKPVNYERPQLLIDNNYAPTVTVDATTNAIVRPQNKAISFWTNESLKDRNGVQIYLDRLSGNTYNTSSGVVYKSRTLQLAGTGANLGAIDTISSFYTDDYGATWNTSDSATPLSTLANLNNDTNGAGWGIEMIEKYGILISTFVNRQTANDTMYLGWSMDFGETWDFAIDNQRAKGEIVITNYSLISGNAITIGVSTITEGVDFDKLQGTEATLKAIRQCIIDNTPYVAYVDVDNNKVVFYNQETIGTAGNGIGCNVTGSGITISANLSGAVNYSSANNYEAYRNACTLNQLNGNTLPDNAQNFYILTNSICDVSDGILFGSHFHPTGGDYQTYAIKIGYSDIFDITNASTTYSLMNYNAGTYTKGFVEPTMSYDSANDKVLVAYRSQTLDGVGYQISTDKGVTWSDIVVNYNKQGRQDNNWLVRLPKSINVGASGWDDNFNFPTGKTFTDALGNTGVPNECYALFNGGRYSSNFYVTTCDNMDDIDDLSKWNWSNFETVNTIKLSGLSRIDKGLQASDAGELNNIPSFCYDKNVRQFYCFWQDYDNSGNMIFKVSIHKI